MYCVHENRFPSWLPSFIIILVFSFRFVRIPYHSIVPFGFSVRITIKHKAPRTPKHNETSDSAHNQIYCNAIFGFTFRSLSPLSIPLSPFNGYYMIVVFVFTLSDVTQMESKIANICPFSMELFCHSRRLFRALFRSSYGFEFILFDSHANVNESIVNKFMATTRFDILLSSREREKNLLALNTDRQCHFNQHHQTQASAHELENIPKMNTQNMCVTWLTKYSRVFCSVVLCARARHCCYFFYCFWFSFLQKSKWLWVFIPTDWIPYRFIGSWLNTNFNAYQTEDR